MTLGQRIYNLRMAKGLSQEEVAEQLDVSRQSVSKWETDTSVPDLDKLMKLCDLFGVSMDELVRGEAPQAERPVEQKTKLQQWLENKRVIAALILLALSFVVRIFGPIGIMLGVYGLIPCAILCLVVKKNTALWCGWLLYVVVFLCGRVLSGGWVWPWTIILGVNSHTAAVFSWVLLLGLIPLVVCTVNAVILHREKTSET